MTTSHGLKINAQVVVRSGPPEPHCRTPSYLRGKSGTVVAEVGMFRDPSRLAYHRPGLPMLRLYRVRFDQRQLWPEYGASKDVLFADLYETWLEPLQEDGRSGSGQENKSHG